MMRTLALAWTLLLGACSTNPLSTADLGPAADLGGAIDLRRDDGAPSRFELRGVVGGTSPLPPEIVLAANEGGKLDPVATAPLDGQRRFAFTSFDESVAAAHAWPIADRFVPNETGITCTMKPTVSPMTTRGVFIDVALASPDRLRGLPWAIDPPPWTTAWSLLWADAPARVAGRLTCTGSKSIDLEYDWTLERGVNWITSTTTRSGSGAFPVSIWVNPPPP